MYRSRAQPSSRSAVSLAWLLHILAAVTAWDIGFLRESDSSNRIPKTWAVTSKKGADSDLGSCQPIEGDPDASVDEVTVYFPQRSGDTKKKNLDSAQTTDLIALYTSQPGHPPCAEYDASLIIRPYDRVLMALQNIYPAEIEALIKNKFKEGQKYGNINFDRKYTHWKDLGHQYGGDQESINRMAYNDDVRKGDVFMKSADGSDQWYSVSNAVHLYDPKDGDDRKIEYQGYASLRPDVQKSTLDRWIEYDETITHMKGEPERRYVTPYYGSWDVWVPPSYDLLADGSKGVTQLDNENLIPAAPLNPALAANTDNNGVVGASPLTGDLEEYKTDF